ncbi:hypothetical protein [Streptomyces sp. SID5910]|uniref:hypothetical protein n=1 Tax=Streptomyces sp. SID5910 TaxID=2690312 RepID=UPI00136932E7|nr:hypothetical protein [Streptomyces sp. SID5910]MYR43096.1 hypothetical protein [Streptomyces sp. SID5910]
MGEQYGAPEVYDSSDEYSRDDRIETYYQGWGAREMAERIVELEDELGADVDGICTGMHADVAEARAEVERVRTRLVRTENLRRVAHYRRDRYRLAWLSARRRAAHESVMATEAVEHLTADRDRWRQRYERLAAELEASRKTTHAPRLEYAGEDEDGPVYKLAESPVSHPGASAP